MVQTLAGRSVARLRRVKFAAAARRQVTAIYRHSRKEFGPVAEFRYALLIEAAVTDLSTDAERPGVRDGPWAMKLYPLRYSRDRPPEGSRVATPRHLFVFCITNDTVSILAILDERADLPARLAALKP